MAALLLDHGANLKNSGAIVAAAAAGKTEMVQFLLKRGADIDEIGIHHPTDRRYDERMGSALHQAIWKGHNELLSLLLKEGADVHLRDIQSEERPWRWRWRRETNNFLSYVFSRKS